MDSMMAPISQMLHQGGMTRRDWFSDRLQDNSSDNDYTPVLSINQSINQSNSTI